MKFAYDLGGAAPHMKRFQINASLLTPGVPVLKGGANTTGIVACTTVAAVGVVGVTVDAAALVTAQQVDNSDPERTVGVIINPSGVYRAKLSGGAAENTALTRTPVSTLSADGLTITTATDWSSPQSDEGVVYGYDGANAGKGRKIISTSITAAVVGVAFPYDTVVGNNFLRIPFCAAPYGYESHFVQLTTLLTQIDASVAVNTTNVNFRVVELELRDFGGDGATKSNALIIANGSVWSAGLVV
jgi:hypothetical protein